MFFGLSLIPFLLISFRQDPTNLIVMKYDTQIVEILKKIQNYSKRLQGIVVADKSDTKCSSSALDKIHEEV